MTQNQLEWMQERGLDPAQYDMTPDGRVIRRQSAEPVQPQREVMSPLRAAGTSFLGSVLPSAAGLYAGAQAGALGGSLAGPVGSVLGAIGGGLAGGYGAGKLQEAALERFAPEAVAEMQRAQTDQPVASYLGGFAPNALALRPSLGGLKGLTAPLMSMERDAMRAAFTPAAVNVGANVAGATAGQLVDLAQGGEFSAPRFAADVALGSLFSDPTRIGRRLGLQPLTPETAAPERLDLAGRRGELAAAADEAASARATELLGGEQPRRTESFGPDSRRFDLAENQRVVNEAFDKLGLEKNPEIIQDFINDPMLSNFRDDPAAVLDYVSEKTGIKARSEAETAATEARRQSEAFEAEYAGKPIETEVKPLQEQIVTDGRRTEVAENRRAIEETLTKFRGQKLPPEVVQDLANDPFIGNVRDNPEAFNEFVLEKADQYLQRAYAQPFAQIERAAKRMEGGLERAGAKLREGETARELLETAEKGGSAPEIMAARQIYEDVYARLQRGGSEGQITQADLDAASKIAARRGLKIELDRVFTDDGQEALGMYFVDEGGNRIIRINPFEATPETAIHEIGHDVFVRSAGERMKKSLMQTAEDSPAFKAEYEARLKEGVNEQTARDLALEEGVIQAFGERYPNVPQGEIRRWFNALKASLKSMVGMKLSPEDAARWLHYATTEAVPWKGVAVGKTGEDRMQRAPVDDAAYLKAVEAGDMETAQRMVDEAAKAAGYNIGPVYHGTDSNTFTVFDRNAPFSDKTVNAASPTTAMSRSRLGFWFSTKPEEAALYGKNILRAWLKGGQVEAMPVSKWARGTPSTGSDSIYVEGDMPFTTDQWVVKRPSQIKSADPITRDDAGNIIPLSKRFQAESPDIRYQRAQQETPEFKNWFGESQVVDMEGKPKFLYHGTGADITQFEKGLFSERALYGPGIYMTESADVAGGLKGYSFKGLKPDDATAEFSFNENTPITEQIKQAKEQAIKEGFTPAEVEDSIFVPGDDATIYMHYQESWQQPNAMPLYAKIEKPFDIDAIPENWVALAEKMDETATRLFGDKYLGIDFDRLARAEVADNISNRYLYDDLVHAFEKGEPRKAHANKVLQAMGYDGITHTGGLSRRYGSGKPHQVWIAFEPEQVKSALGNRGTFSPESPDIRYQRSILSEAKTPAELDYLASKGGPFAEVAGSLKAAYNTRDFKQGQWSNKYSLTTKLPEEARVRLLNHLAGEFDSGVRSTPAADIRAAYDQIRNEYLPAIVNDYNNAGFMVRDTAGLRARGSNPTYFPLHAISDEVKTILTSQQGSPEYTKLRDDFLKWNTQLKQADGASLAEAQRYAQEKFEDMQNITAQRPGIESGIPFSGARKPEGYPLPPSWRSDDIVEMLNNYTRRSTTDFAYQQHVESSPVAMAALGAKTMLNNQPIPANVLQSTAPVITDPSVQSVLREYRGTPAQKTEGALQSFGRFITAATIGNVSKVGDIGTSSFKGLAYLPPSEYASGLAQFVNKIADFAALKERSYASGLNKRDAAENMRQVLGIAEDSTAFMDKAARLLSKVTLVNELESVARVIAQGWGETVVGINKKLALGGDKNATQMLDTLSPDWRTRSDADLAAQVGRLLQGSYDMRQLPASVLEGAAAPYLTWSKWSIGQYDSFVKYAIRPAMQGNMKPLMGQMIIGLLGGGAVSAVQEWLNNREGKDITWKELEAWMEQNQGEIGADGGQLLAQKLLTMAQKMGTFGFAGDLTKMIVDAAAGGSAQGIATMPAVDAIYDVSKRTAAALQALDDGEDFGLVMKALMKDSLVGHVQALRVARNWLDEDENLRYDDRRRRRLYDELSGLPSKGGAFSVNYSNLSEREFERGEIGEGTGEEAMSLVRRAREQATTPEDYASRIRKLKTAQNQIMPSLERQPMKAARYLSWLEGTEEGLGSETMRRYMIRRGEDEYRKSLIEGLSGLR